MNRPGSQNAGLEQSLDQLPDLVADALQAWRLASLEREKLEALLYLRFKGGEGKKTSDEIKAMVRSDGERYTKCLAELLAETNYQRLLERLYSVKKLAALRTAF
jgi:hypothetical protein